jgi:cytochrome c biogenesis protein CcmG/thiol:disulfide interchange protein DsbE
VSESPRPTWRLLVVSTVLALLAAAGTVVLLSDDGGDTDDGASAPITLVPKDEVPTFDEAAYTTFDGEEVPLSSVRGTPTVLNFWASYCSPCLKEMPALEEVYQEAKGSADLAFLGLTVSDRTDDALEMVDRTGITYPTAQDKDASVFTSMEAVVLPTTVLLDAEGEVVARHAGELTAEELRKLLADELDIQL